MDDFSPRRYPSGGHDGHTRDSFLSSHRAIAVCMRELAHLTEEVTSGVAALSGVSVEEKAVVRQTPRRCIVQLGPVALTVAWLHRALDSVAEGQLLVIIWRGAVAPRGEHYPERATTRSVPAPTALYEQVFTAVADVENAWAWRIDRGNDVYSSAALGARCVERLRLAYMDVRSRSTPPQPALAHG